MSLKGMSSEANTHSALDAQRSGDGASDLTPRAAEHDQVVRRGLVASRFGQASHRSAHGLDSDAHEAQRDLLSGQVAVAFLCVDGLRQLLKGFAGAFAVELLIFFGSKDLGAVCGGGGERATWQAGQPRMVLEDRTKSPSLSNNTYN